MEEGFKCFPMQKKNKYIRQSLAYENLPHPEALVKVLDFQAECISVLSFMGKGACFIIWTGLEFSMRLNLASHPCSSYLLQSVRSGGRLYYTMLILDFPSSFTYISKKICWFKCIYF